MKTKIIESYFLFFLSTFAEIVRLLPVFEIMYNVFAF